MMSAARFSERYCATRSFSIADFDAEAAAHAS
jgi:hypothetical protein